MFENLIVLAARSGFSSWLPMILIYAVLIGGMFWWTSRRRKQMAQRQEEMHNGLVKGASVVTIGGLHGIVDSVDNDKKIVTLDVEGVFLPFDLRAIAKIGPAASSVDTKITADVKKPDEAGKKDTDKEK
ncbi:MAG: preprotein translocase subunit YajC [Oenococcus sp.]|uniref:preprotein translocase subunit YajC n=1 Tax=Oenococcus TaxID=46254 RepID=UPI0021E83248|nr:preprotein translocase subunit YajC [Oenococcus kitaharae]MCV3296102.1 preprotein translocase subunit YajC [Oenococcus kitaharae]